MLHDFFWSSLTKFSHFGSAEISQTLCITATVRTGAVRMIFFGNDFSRRFFRDEYHLGTRFLLKQSMYLTLFSTSPMFLSTVTCTRILVQLSRTISRIVSPRQIAKVPARKKQFGRVHPTMNEMKAFQLSKTEFLVLTKQIWFS